VALYRFCHRSLRHFNPGIGQCTGLALAQVQVKQQGVCLQNEDTTELNQVAQPPDASEPAAAVDGSILPAEASATDSPVLPLDIDIGSYLPGFMQEGWQFLRDYEVLLMLVILLISYAIGKAMKTLIEKFIARLARSANSTLENQIIQYLSAPIMQTAITVGLILIVLSLEFSDIAQQLSIRILLTLLMLLWGRAWFKATSVILEALESSRAPCPCSRWVSSCPWWACLFTCFSASGVSTQPLG
jgi:hypothetical protein